MKNRNIHHRTMTAVLFALVIGGLSLSSAVLADNPNNNRSIVGMWRVVYSGDFAGVEAFDQWQRDGTEIEVANIFGLSCQGVFKQTGRNVTLFHTGWNYDANGALTGYFNESQTITVSTDGQTYDGTFIVKDYDQNGNQLDELTGGLHATRLSVNTPL